MNKWLFLLGLAIVGLAAGNILDSKSAKVLENKITELEKKVNALDPQTKKVRWINQEVAKVNQELWQMFPEKKGTILVQPVIVRWGPFAVELGLREDNVVIYNPVQVPAPIVSLPNQDVQKATNKIEKKKGWFRR